MTTYADLLDLPMTETERTAIDALVEHGSQNAAAEALGWKRTRLQSRLRAVQARHAAAAAAAAAVTPEPPVVHGRVSVRANQTPATEPGATTTRYILTSAQNNTHVHAEFLRNLEAYAEANGARIMVARFSYNKSAYGAKSTKAGRAPSARDTSELWYDPAILPYVCDDPERHGSCRWQLAPDLVFCSEMNILPTAVRPLSGLESYSGSASGIFPHAKIALESVAVIGDRAPKMNYTTGSVTQRNYIAKKEGLKGEFHHQFGALIVEVDLLTGDWWARQLNATDDGSFYDLTFRVAGGEVSYGHRLAAMNWGDIHASEIDPTVRALNWGKANGRAVIDTLMPEYQIWHDTFSMRSRGHHELKSFASRYAKHMAGVEHDSVEREVQITADLMRLAHRDWCQTVVVSSNHDRHLDKWLEEADYKADPANAEFFLEAQLARVRAIRERRDWDGLAWALSRCEDLPPVRFLARDESFVICGPEHPVECGSHGDEGPNGARGNAANLSKLGVRMNVGHAHSACLVHGLAQAGVCNRRLPYAHGASSWSITHAATYQNGKRAMLTQRAGKLWL